MDSLLPYEKILQFQTNLTEPVLHFKVSLVICLVKTRFPLSPFQNVQPNRLLTVTLSVWVTAVSEVVQTPADW